jgi:hypothetical protein
MALACRTKLILAPADQAAGRVGVENRISLANRRFKRAADGLARPSAKGLARNNFPMS